MEARRIHPCDWQEVEALVQRARRTFPRLWWWEEHLNDDRFVVVEHEGLVAGALLACSDKSPVAWVRLAVLDDGLDVGEWLDLVLPPVLDEIRRRGTRELAWMDYEGWAESDLIRRGFRLLTEVVTLSKADRALPDIGVVDVRLRPVSDADVPGLTTVDRAAFDPHWWHSEDTMRRRAALASYFTVAELAGDVVGYAEGRLSLPVAHLNRVAVHPAHQSCGVGSALLHSALRAFWRRGAEQVTLNTQRDNHRSRRLYLRFGFRPAGERVNVWRLQFCQEE